MRRMLVVVPVSPHAPSGVGDAFLANGGGDVALQMRGAQFLEFLRMPGRKERRFLQIAHLEAAVVVEAASR